MQWARRHTRTRHRRKLFLGASLALIISLFIPLATPASASAASSLSSSLASASTTVAAGAGTLDLDDCNRNAENPISWAVCALVNMVQGATDVMQKAIDHLMLVDIKGTFDTSTDSGKAYYSAWNSFRIFAIAIIVIAGLIMVISTALGFEIFDNYTIKKVLPRILVAVIGISLSWWLLKFLAELTNDVGIGIRSLIYFPFEDLATEYEGVQNIGSKLIFILGTSGAIIFLGIGGLLSIVATIGLAALVAFLVLVLRQVIITFLILIAPIAIACYVLPNTQKVYNLWWDSLFKGLMMFPIISAFIAAGGVFAVVASSNPNGDFGLSQTIAMFAYFLPYFALPFTFRLAGGAIATLGGLVNDRSRGSFDRLRNYRGRKIQENSQAMKTGNRFKGSSLPARAFNRTTENIAAVPHAGFNPRRMRSRMQSALSRQSMEEAAEFSEKNDAMRAIINNDDFLQAGLKGRGSDKVVRQELARMGYGGAGLEQGVAAIRAARRGASDEVFETAAAMALPATGTAFKGGAGEMHELINEVAGNDRVKAGRMLAAMRSGAGSARRFDLAGGGFGDQIATLEAQHSGKMTVEQANEHIFESSLEGQGGSYIAGARNSAVKNFAPVMRKKLEAAYHSGDDKAFKQELAVLAGRYDAMAQVAPENARMLADGVMSESIAGRTDSVRDMIESMRNDTDFLDMRREYGASSLRGAAQAEQAALAAQYAGNQGPQGPPQAPPQGPVMG